MRPFSTNDQKLTCRRIGGHRFHGKQQGTRCQLYRSAYAQEVLRKPQKWPQSADDREPLVLVQSVTSMVARATGGDPLDAGYGRTYLLKNSSAWSDRESLVNDVFVGHHLTRGDGYPATNGNHRTGCSQCLDDKDGGCESLEEFRRGNRRSLWNRRQRTEENVKQEHQRD